MGSPFRITAALWDRIHHYASFPQTGGQRIAHLLCPRLTAVRLSVAATDGPLWTEPIPGHALQGKPVSRR